MDIFFFLVTFIIFVVFIGLIVGLIKPSIVIKWGNKEKITRWKVLRFYGLLMIVCFVLWVISVPEMTPEEEVAYAAEQKLNREKDEAKERAEVAAKAEKIAKAKEEAEAAAKAEKIAKAKEEAEAATKAKKLAKVNKESEKSVKIQTSVVGSASTAKESKNSGENKKNDDSNELEKLFINAAEMCEKEKWKNCNDISKDILGTTKKNGDAYFLSGFSKYGLLATGALQNVEDYREVSMLSLIREAQNASTLEEALDQSNQIKNILETAISNNKIIIETSSNIYSEFKKADSINDEIGEEYNNLIASASYIKKYTTLENKYFSNAQKMNTFLNDWIAYSIDWNEAHFKDDEDGMDKAWNKMIELENKIDGYEEKLIKSSDELDSFAEKSEVNWEHADQETERFLEVILNKYN